MTDRSVSWMSAQKLFPELVADTTRGAPTTMGTMAVSWQPSWLAAVRVYVVDVVMPDANGLYMLASLRNVEGDQE